MDKSVVNLINECGKYLYLINENDNMNEKEKYLLGLILTINDYGNNSYNSEIDIYNLTPKDIIIFPKEFIENNNNNNNNNNNLNIFNNTEYEWTITVFIIKTKTVIKFAKCNSILFAFYYLHFIQYYVSIFCLELFVFALVIYPIII